ncbi:MAG TPA: lipoprotein LpqH [Mycobacterium sp.]|nr:lipoprotein LpqH [Mycobacterium sp.]
MKRGCVVAIGSAAIVGVALVGCSSGSGNGAGAPASSASGASAPTAGVKVVVDGKARPVQNKVECVKAANMVMANIGSEQDGIAVTLSAGDNPAMQDLTLGMVDGLPLTYDESNAGPKPTVTKTGFTYKIVGTASSPSPAGTGTVSKPFDMEFTCPPRR